MNTNFILPPGVCGEQKGHLVLKVDEVYWLDSSTKNVTVQLKWWGSDVPHYFYPKDVTKSKNCVGSTVKPEGSREIHFDVCTSPGLFEAYLRNCHALKFQIFDFSRKIILGSALVNNFEDILNSRPYSSYYPIVSKRDPNTLVGDLHIIFDLCFYTKQTSDVSTTTKETSKVEFKREADLNLQKQEQMLSQVVTRGQELRKAMVSSVLASCDVDKIEEVVNIKNYLPLENIARTPSEEARLMDFLLGKEMSQDEEVKALNLLRCHSPTTSYLELAAASEPLLKRPELPSEEQQEQPKPKLSKLNVYSSSATIQSSMSKEIPAPPGYNNVLMNDRLGATYRPNQDSLDEKNPNYIKVDTYKFGVGSLHLNLNGCRKIHNTNSNRHDLKKLKSVAGLSFILELVLADFKQNKWVRHVSFLSKYVDGNEVKFGEFTVIKVRSNIHPWLKVSKSLGNAELKIFWRFPHQKIPACLGSATLPADIYASSFTKTYWLPVITKYGLVVGKLHVKVDLGIGQHYGSTLNQDTRREVVELRRQIELYAKEEEELQNQIQDRIRKSPSYSRSISQASYNTDPSKKSSEDLVNKSELSRPHSAPSSKETVRDNQRPLLEAIGGLAGKLKENLDMKKKSHYSKRFDHASKASSNEKENIVVPGGKMSAVDSCECCCCCKRKYCRASQATRVKARRASKSKPKQCSCEENVEDQIFPHKADVHEDIGSGISPDIEVGNIFANQPNVVECRDYGNKEDDTAKKSYKSPHDMKENRATTSDSKTSENESYSFKRSQSSPSIKEAPYTLAEDKTPKATPACHSYRIDVYSCDAQAFFREGELELFLAYDFPAINLDTGQIEFTNNPTVIYLNGDRQIKNHKLNIKSCLFDELRSLPKNYIEFQLWAKSFLFNNEKCLVATAKLPLRRLAQWEADYLFAHKNFENNFDDDYSYDKHFVNLRLEQESSILLPGLQQGMITQLGLEIEYKIDEYNPKKEEKNKQNRKSKTGKKYSSASRGRDNSLSMQKKQFVESEKENRSRNFNLDNDEFVFDLYAKKHPLRSSARKKFENVKDELEYLKREFKEPVIENDPITGDPVDRRINDNYYSNTKSYFKAEYPVQEQSEDDYWGKKSLQEKRSLSGEDYLKHSFEGISDPPSFLEERKTKSPDFPGHVDMADFNSEGTSDKHNPFEHSSTSKAQQTWRNKDQQSPDSFTYDLTFERPCSVINNSPPPKSTYIYHPSPIEAGHSYSTRKSSDPGNPRYGAKSSKTASDLNENNSQKSSPEKSSSPIIETIDLTDSPGHRESIHVDEIETKSPQTSKKPSAIPNLPVYFSARVEVERAINLTTRNKSNCDTKVLPSSFVRFKAWDHGKEVIYESSKITEDQNPFYNATWQVQLPSNLLYKGESEFELSVVTELDGNQQVSRANIDLTALAAGLPFIDGWYLLINGSKSQGQLKVSVKPLEDIRMFKDAWSKEGQRKTATMNEFMGSSTDRCGASRQLVLTDMHYANSLQEKLTEMKALTDKMNEKLANPQSFYSSAPHRLLDEVNKARDRIFQEEMEIIEKYKASKSQKKSPSVTKSPICLSDSTDDSPVLKPRLLDNGKESLLNRLGECRALSRDYEDDDSESVIETKSQNRHSGGPYFDVLQVESLFDSIPKDNLEAASDKIDKIIEVLRRQRIGEG